MTSAFQIDRDVFFEAKDGHQRFTRLLAEYMTKKSGLVINFGQNHVSFLLIDSPGSSWILDGEWSDEILLSCHIDKVASKVFIPFVFNFNRIMLPPNVIFSLPDPGRSLANFLAVNFLYSQIRNCQTIFVTSTVRGEQHESIDAFRRQYLSVIQSFFKEACLSINDPDKALELLLLNLSQPVMNYESILLNIGSLFFRNAKNIKLEKADIREHYFNRIIAARDKMMKHFG